MEVRVRRENVALCFARAWRDRAGEEEGREMVRKEERRGEERRETFTEPEPEKQTERVQLVLSPAFCLQPVRAVKLTSS